MAGAASAASVVLVASVDKYDAAKAKRPDTVTQMSATKIQTGIGAHRGIREKPGLFPGPKPAGLFSAEPNRCYSSPAMPTSGRL